MFFQSKRSTVQHNYHDHSNDKFCDIIYFQLKRDMLKIPRGGVAVPFPMKLHFMLSNAEENGFAHIISWQHHGRCLIVHQPAEFAERVLPIYFHHSKLTSFQRQLSIYGFLRLTSGADKTGYYHELFLQHRMFLCNKMKRYPIKGNGIKAKANPKDEPNFNSMPKVTLDYDSIELNRDLKEMVAALINKEASGLSHQLSENSFSKKHSGETRSTLIKTQDQQTYSKVKVAFVPNSLNANTQSPATRCSILSSKYTASCKGSLQSNHPKQQERGDSESVSKPFKNNAEEMSLEDVMLETSIKIALAQSFLQYLQVENTCSQAQTDKQPQFSASREHLDTNIAITPPPPVPQASARSSNSRINQFSSDASIQSAIIPPSPSHFIYGTICDLEDQQDFHSFVSLRTSFTDN